MWREVEGETGLTRDDLTAESLWHTVFDGPRIALVRILLSDVLDLTLSRRRWPFAEQRRAEIEDHFSALRKAKPRLWNGRVLMLDHYAGVGKTFRGDFLETDFASFIERHCNVSAACLPPSSARCS